MKTFGRNYFVCLVALFASAWVLPNVSLGYAEGQGFNWEDLVMALPIILVASLILTLLMMAVKPLMKTIFLPINFLTLGLFNLAMNVLLIWLATYLVPGFTVG
jgi:uncharacterized membrane protein YvlD (DUF360 family)